MYCTSCGTELSSDVQYCPQCGTPARGVGFPRPKRTTALSRPREDRKIAGVCSGIARYLGIDVTLVRIIVAVLAIWPPGVGLILYIVCWIVMPRDPLLLPAPRPDGQSQSLTAT